MVLENLSFGFKSLTIDKDKITRLDINNGKISKLK